MILICNGKYNPKLFSFDKIVFEELLGYKVDLNNVKSFLKKTVYDPEKYPENVYIIIDSSKEEFEAKFKEIDNVIAKLSKENKRRIYPFIYYSGHGVTLMVNGK